MRSRRPRAAVCAAVLLLVGLAGCGGNGGNKSVSGQPHGDASSQSPPTSKAQISSTIAADAAGVRVNRSVRLDVSDGTFSDVSVTGNGDIEATCTRGYGPRPMHTPSSRDADVR